MIEVQLSLFDTEAVSITLDEVEAVTISLEEECND